MSTPEAPHNPTSAPASGFAATFSQTLRSLEAAQKPGIGVPAYTRWVNRRVARYFAAVAVALGITPNGVTAISAMCSAAGLVVLITCPPTIGVGICVALLFALGYGLDSADGQVARNRCILPGRRMARSRGRLHSSTLRTHGDPTLLPPLPGSLLLRRFQHLQ